MVGGRGRPARSGRVVLILGTGGGREACHPGRGATKKETTTTSASQNGGSGDGVCVWCGAVRLDSRDREPALHECQLEKHLACNRKLRWLWRRRTGARFGWVSECVSA